MKNFDINHQEHDQQDKLKHMQPELLKIVRGCDFDGVVEHYIHFFTVCYTIFQGIWEVHVLYSFLGFL